MSAEMPSPRKSAPGKGNKQKNVKIESRSHKRERLEEDLSDLQTAVNDFVSIAPPNSPETTHVTDSFDL